MWDFVIPLYRNSRGTFYRIIWRHHRTPSLIPPLRETVNVWLVVRVCVHVWFFSTGSAPHATVSQTGPWVREDGALAACCAASSLSQLWLLWWDFAWQLLYLQQSAVTGLHLKWPELLSHGPQRGDEGKSQTKSYPKGAVL